MKATTFGQHWKIEKGKKRAVEVEGRGMRGVGDRKKLNIETG